MNLMPHARPSADLATTTADVLFYATGGCAFGTVLIARSIKGVCAILLGDDARALEDDLARRFPHSTLVPNEVMVRDDLAKVARYADKPSVGLDLTLDMRGTPIQRRVWNALRSIPLGETRSYMQVARLINGAYPQATARIVANACAANPLALVIPCHRVIRTDGELAGYCWGLERKRVLLEKEASA
ncbi:methylated-DNA--[protein]-cysteine S-methyltransferase [Bradyrhizobium sp. CCBAU 53421]|uniref:methylated-DNA--[protein]-cysteine S-methyltransferase n=1 Tax=Bradyrhizobium sp. CCBAU 53421 TaxID=1325120 RepID=UPI00188DA9DE|nr:methylated-DNA--[protein]-cysteine S-methyltransferase [Bradyrhizobium sp. CCBAU 53421]QOZ37461.1 cysteine methyltransferase [Bradyrhizobium sp. CCBAU 53421]